MKLVHSQFLTIAGADINATAFTSGAAQTSDPVRVNKSTGHAALLVILADTPDVDITFEVSMDNKNWYAPVDTAGTSLATIYTTLTSSAWIVFDPQVAEWIRFIIDPDADSTVSAKFIQQEGN